MDSMALNGVSQGLIGAENATLQRFNGLAGSTGAPAPANGNSFADLLTAASSTAAADAGTAKQKMPVVDKSSKLYEQCEALETFFLKNLISGMRKTVEKTDFTKGGFAGEIYEDMLYDEYAKNFSRNANFGMAELAYLELTGQRGKVISR